MADVVAILFVADVIATVVFLWQIIAILFVADVIATVMYFIGRCYCHVLVG